MNDEDVARLLDIERIKQLKSRYCRFIDTKQWSALRTLFAPNARFEGFASAPTGADADTFVKGVSTRLKDAITVHHCHTPDIVFIEATTARAVWAMADYLEWPTKINLREAPEARGLLGLRSLRGGVPEDRRRLENVHPAADAAAYRSVARRPSHARQRDVACIQRLAERFTLTGFEVHVRVFDGDRRHRLGRVKSCSERVIVLRRREE